MIQQPARRFDARTVAMLCIFLWLLSLPTGSAIGILTLMVAGRYAWKLTGGLPAWLAGTRASPPAPLGATHIGRTLDGGPVCLTRGQLAAHGLFLGATGSGKTTSLLAILCDQITHGAPVVAIDLKGSRQFADQLAAAATAAGRPFRVWRPEGPAHWNPLAHGDATELKDKLFGAERFTEPHYQRAGERYLQTALQVLHAARPDQPATLAGVVDALDVTMLRSLLHKVPKEMMARVGPYIGQLSRDQQSAILGLQSRLALLSESTVGTYLQPGPDEIDLRHTLTGGDEVVLFSLNASRYGKLSAQVAAMVIQDLITVAGHRLTQTSRPLALVAIDEFSALDSENLLHLLARARESGISVLLSTQELADLERLTPGFRDQVLGNTGLVIAHRQNVPASAELIAQIAGTRKVWQQTYQTEQTIGLLGASKVRQTGLGTSKEVDEFRIHPNLIKELRTGQAAVITKTPTSNATITRIEPWQPR
jgi:type IV secretory pathway TraG/TraD family ATPase VirD4